MVTDAKRAASVPIGRASRLLHMGRVVADIAGGEVAGGLRPFTTNGVRPRSALMSRATTGAPLGYVVWAVFCAKADDPVEKNIVRAQKATAAMLIAHRSSLRSKGEVDLSGPVAVLFRSGVHVKQPYVRRPRGFSVGSVAHMA